MQERRYLFHILKLRLTDLRRQLFVQDADYSRLEFVIAGEEYFYWFSCIERSTAQRLTRLRDESKQAIPGAIETLKHDFYVFFDDPEHLKYAPFVSSTHRVYAETGEVASYGTQPLLQDRGYNLRVQIACLDYALFLENYESQCLILDEIFVGWTIFEPWQYYRATIQDINQISADIIQMAFARALPLDSFLNEWLWATTYASSSEPCYRIMVASTGKLHTFSWIAFRDRMGDKLGGYTRHLLTLIEEPLMLEQLARGIEEMVAPVLAAPRQAAPDNTTTVIHNQTLALRPRLRSTKALNTATATSTGMSFNIGNGIPTDNDLLSLAIRSMDSLPLRPKRPDIPISATAYGSPNTNDSHDNTLPASTTTSSKTSTFAVAKPGLINKPHNPGLSAVQLMKPRHEALKEMFEARKLQGRRAAEADTSGIDYAINAATRSVVSLLQAGGQDLRLRKDMKLAKQEQDAWRDDRRRSGR